ncbi:MAG TPA: DUF4139 domain-containing protein [Anaerolineae bacterium]|nr:DUF4139 domain-containing protein [Anaerolineae bacterium]
MAKKRWMVWIVLAVVTLATAGVAAWPGTGSGAMAAQEEVQQTNVELAVYNQDLALVKEQRQMTLQEGLNEVRFADVAALIDPASVHFESITDPDGTVVVEQNYEYDVVGTAKLLQKYVDQEIAVVTEDGQEYVGMLLSGAEDVILQAADGQVTVLKVGQIKEFAFPALPDGLITRPTLVWLVESAEGGSQDVEVTYLTNGINWEADYIVVLSADETSLDLNGWVTLDNRSGTAYEDAKLKLIAGDIQREYEERAIQKDVYYEAVPAGAPQVEERDFFEYHLYEVQRPVTVKDNQTKQIEFVTATGVPASKFFVYDGAQMSYYPAYAPLDDPGYGTSSNTKVMVMVEFENGEEQGLGVPLPKGVLRVYQQDVDGSTLLVGEDSIDHTPRDEQVRLYVGDAFDIVGERVQTDFQADYDDEWMEETFRITLRNHKDEDVEVRVVEHLFRWSAWTILDASHEFEKTDAQTIEFRIPVEANGEVEITYTARYEW